MNPFAKPERLAAFMSKPDMRLIAEEVYNRSDLFKMKILLCFGSKDHIVWFSHRFGLGYKSPSGPSIIVPERPVCWKVGGLGSVMGLERQTTGYMKVGRWFPEMGSEAYDAFLVCRDRYHDFGSYEI